MGKRFSNTDSETKFRRVFSYGTTAQLGPLSPVVEVSRSHTIRHTPGMILQNE